MILSGHMGEIMEEYNEGLQDFFSHTRFKVGAGLNIRFWHDLWCWDNTFKETFRIHMVL
jgi:hypothetical protein